mmetsp:Transcript_1509/g.3003  ORF Transcript_1509/g.3003 Transcript_1509/m.3003 type:complete len:231 (-) Transcript_1509:115-807(-)|eukprot:CAMPEP_0119058712 /NCGR_PEP_ID=MMETSP1178-20130426/2983_1 /TAXON_ID=33656 /ORGANISM="unid sp, Strain CCMP2000" /LENGTH=230 /DNA_ID=CAMNT_0007039681 /DNA_START=59 /DNA_END=751 /DNA_ORIENTATION=+
MSSPQGTPPRLASTDEDTDSLHAVRDEARVGAVEPLRAEAHGKLGGGVRLHDVDQHPDAVGRVLAAADAPRAGARRASASASAHRRSMLLHPDSGAVQHHPCARSLPLVNKGEARLHTHSAVGRKPAKALVDRRGGQSAVAAQHLVRSPAGRSEVARPSARRCVEKVGGDEGPLRQWARNNIEFCGVHTAVDAQPAGDLYCKLTPTFSSLVACGTSWLHGEERRALSGEV